MTPWQVNPYRLVSLNNMQQFLGHSFAHLSRVLGKLQQLSIDVNKTDRGPLQRGEREQLKKFMQQLLEGCQVIHLDLSCKHIVRVQRALDGPQCNHLTVIPMLDFASNLIYDEMEKTLFLHVDSDKAIYYQEPVEAFGLRSLESLFVLSEDFSSVSLNIQEAGKCFALGRNTAAVFHLMRIMEAGLRVMCNKASQYGLTFPDPEHNRSWDTWLKPLDKQLNRKTEEKSAEWRAVESIYAEITVDLRNVARAWRNKAMHLDTEYGPEQALKIYLAVKSFMEDLTEKLLTRHDELK